MHTFGWCTGEGCGELRIITYKKTIEKISCYFIVAHLLDLLFA